MPHTTPPFDASAPWPEGDALDQALSQALRAPALPPGFRASLHAAIARDAAGQSAQLQAQLQARLAALEAEHAQGLARLDADYIQLRRQTLAQALALSFTSGASAAALLPWLAENLHSDVGTLAPYAVAAVVLSLVAWATRGRLFT